ncbi:MAG: glycosyltransferase family 4 protein [Syntrophobacteraceae bacterium]
MKAYVVGGYINHGGTLMAYHLGRILYESFGCECVIANVADETPDTSFYRYPYRFESIDIQSMLKEIEREDILIANPSFSYHMFGLRCNCKKIMYIQHFNTFDVIDGFFDHYVCVSSIVSQFVRKIYNIRAEVIPAFIQLDLIPFWEDWDKRPERGILAAGKHYFDLLLLHFGAEVRRKHPELRYELFTLPSNIPHPEVVAHMARYRYFLVLSPLEGFGLMPLEAMACGCTVMGFDGCGGADYMRDGINCATTWYPDFEGLIDRVADTLGNPAKADALAKQGSLDAMRYNQRAFDQRWVDFFTKVLN